MCSFEIKKLETLDLIFWAEQRRCAAVALPLICDSIWQHGAGPFHSARSSQAHLPVLANGGAVPAVT